jgi:hypothetical protein
VTFLLFFGASTVPLGKEVIPKLEWSTAARDLSSGLYLVTYLGLVIGFVWSLILISRALTPRIARHHQSPREGSELLYYEHVIRHRDSTQ